MQHNEWQELIPFYIAKTLPAKEQQSFEQHLATCADCAQEIKEWKQIAAAVWTEADNAARHVPPLSQEVYNRLSNRERPPTSQYIANPPRPDYAPKQPIVRPIREVPSRNISLPVTMVAGIIVAFLFGALLIMMALRDNTDTPADMIALNATGSAEAFLDAQNDDMTATPINTELPTQAGNNGILPTPVPFVTDTPLPNPPTLTPVPTPLPGGWGGGNGNLDVPTSIPPATVEQMTIMIDADATNEGPFITLTPGLNESGIFQCFLFNPTNVPIDGFEYATTASAIIAEIAPGQEYRTLVRSDNGWYQIVIAPGRPIWIPPTTAYLRGNCDASQFWIPTPTIFAQSFPTDSNPVGEIVPASGDTTVVVESAFANFYSGPGFNFETIDVTERGKQFPVIAYTTVDGESWIQVRTPQGQLLWLWASIVTEYDNADLPTNP